MKHLIPYKGIIHNVMNDAPFIGAIVIANTCNKGCSECINEHLKSSALTRWARAEHIVEEVKSNGLNQGIILSGLEWTEQAEDLEKLVYSALLEKLKVMIYTHHTEETFFELLPDLKSLPIYIKFGEFDLAHRAKEHYSHGVKLATSNQYIKLFS